jgi:hypothetical protein
MKQRFQKGWGLFAFHERKIKRCIAGMTAHYRQAFDDHQAKVLAEATVQIEACAIKHIPRILAERSGFLTKSSVPETIYADDRGNEIDIICRGTIASRPAAVLREGKTNITNHDVGVNGCWPLWWGRCGFLSLALRAWMGGNPPLIAAN